VSPVAAPVERFLETHPDAAAAWYPAMASVVGRVLSVPVLDRWLPLARRVHAVAQPSGWTTLLPEPRVVPPAACAGLTVLSANLWHDWPRQHRWTERLEAVARLVEAEGVDVLLLQEVARTRSMHSDRWLADRLGMSLAYARANGDADAIGFEEGLAVLSRFPLGDIHLTQLSSSRNPLVRRVALGAEATTPRGPVLCVSVHLGLRHDPNAAQLRTLRAWVAEVSGDVLAIVGGDFNAPEDRAEIMQSRTSWMDAFRQAHPDAVTSTHLARTPWGRRRGPRTLDYVFVQQPAIGRWRVTAAGHVDAPGGPHSDHRAVLARLLPEDRGGMEPGPEGWET
jgi:endonuclease/exonuclease/phosphatase family metal-dependent hydrolase